MSQPSSFDLEDRPLQEPGRQSKVSLSSQDSESIASLSFPLPATLTPATSRPLSESQSISNVSDSTTRLNLNPSVMISFVKGGRLFKLSYSYIDVLKDDNGSLKRLEAGESSGQQCALIHTCDGSRSPIPHLEQPIVSNKKPPFRVSFLEGQTIETARTAFASQPSYTFGDWDDCVHFQEALLGHKVLLVAGIAGARSKGRGEECISQNLRILRARNGSQTIIFFANSQRKEKKRYISIPVSCIDRIDQSKKGGRQISLRLHPNSELLSELKVLQIKFLDNQDQMQFYKILCPDVGG